MRGRRQLLAGIGAGTTTLIAGCLNGQPDAYIQKDTEKTTRDLEGDGATWTWSGSVYVDQIIGTESVNLEFTLYDVDGRIIDTFNKQLNGVGVQAEMYSATYFGTISDVRNIYRYDLEASAIVN